MAVGKNKRLTKGGKKGGLSVRWICVHVRQVFLVLFSWMQLYYILIRRPPGRGRVDGTSHCLGGGGMKWEPQKSTTSEARQIW